VKIKKRKLQLVSITIIATAFILAMLSVGKASNSEPNILTIGHQPTNVTQNTNITITVTFTDDENVTSVRIQYCSIEPIYQCHIPQIEMIRTTTNTWIGSFVVLEEIGIIGYQIYVDFTGGSIIAPNSSDYLGYDNIIETHTDVFYFSIVLSTISETAPLNISVPSIIAAYTVFAIIRHRNKKK